MMFRRRREMKTDYAQRLALLKSGRPRLVIRRALNNIRVQVIRYERGGDVVVSEALSKELKKYGWHAHGNIPSAYLTGLLAGLRARKAGVTTAVADIGLQTSVKGSSLYAAVLGAKDAGIDMPVSKDVLPDAGRISGQHIAGYAAMLKKEQGKYAKQFSAYIKNNIDPERLPELFAETKNKIMKEFGAEMKQKKEVVAAAGANGETFDESSNSDEEWEDSE